MTKTTYKSTSAKDLLNSDNIIGRQVDIHSTENKSEVYKVCSVISEDGVLHAYIETNGDEKLDIFSEKLNYFQSNSIYVALPSKLECIAKMLTTGLTETSNNNDRNIVNLVEKNKEEYKKILLNKSYHPHLN